MTGTCQRDGATCRGGTTRFIHGARVSHAAAVVDQDSDRDGHIIAVEHGDRLLHAVLEETERVLRQTGKIAARWLLLGARREMRHRAGRRWDGQHAAAR